MKESKGSKWLGLSFIAAIASGMLLTGCQTTIGGQTLPSPNYLGDDVQYHPAGPEFKHATKVAASRKFNEEQTNLMNP